MLTCLEPAGIVPVSVPASTPVPVFRLILTAVLLTTAAAVPWAV